jgi:valyl-tRNA synthetase
MSGTRQARPDGPPAKAYVPSEVEARWYARWEAEGRFAAEADDPRPAYCLVIPPPNVTGSLHMGHALNNTLQDILIRWRRMTGDNALWMPGTDHAGIATQNVVERQLAAAGQTKEALGRAAFIERVWAWKAESGGTIIQQLKSLGASCDWRRERFTMDAGLSRAVREVFVRLWEDGLIYRGDYIVNWCPRCRTALSDLEVEYEERDGQLYYIRYGPLTLATVRPETKLGDTALAVHPGDARYAAYVGQTLSIRSVEGTIRMRVLADEAVDPAFGTGVVKVTPAHDPADFEIGRRHGLEVRQVIGFDGRMNERAGTYRGLDRFECRTRIVEDLGRLGLLEKLEPYRHRVGVCYRCRTVVEPLISPQWFVRAKPLAEPAIRAVADGRIRIIPASWEKSYFEWMENIRDWCISRQIWWGHRLPVWTCEGCGTRHVSRTDLARCPACAGPLRQETDVLDTWFSSALWPFSTLGWPERTPELLRFYPTACLVTGFDILFFWVARMIMLGLRFMSDVPFREVYIHALVRDAEGQKMSKTRGNVIDPVEVIGTYGADSLRFTLTAMAAQGRDIKLSDERIESSRHFCNKLWNAYRFLAPHLEGFDPERAPLDPRAGELADQWLLSRVQALIAGVTEALEAYRFNDAAAALYQFLWHEYCDWYVEIVKGRLAEPGPAREAGIALLRHGLEVAVRLLHPIMPFITEEIWQRLPGAGPSIMSAPWPRADPALVTPRAVEVMEALMAVTRAIRNLRSEFTLAPSREVAVVLRTATPAQAAILGEGLPYIRRLARAEVAGVGPAAPLPPSSAMSLAAGIEVHLSLEGVDVAGERERLAREVSKLETERGRRGRKLADPAFLAKAPPEVVAKERRRQAELDEARAKLEGALRALDWAGRGRA